MRKRTWIGMAIWSCVAAVIWGAMVFLLVVHVSNWPGLRRDLQLIYQEAGLNPEWNHTIQGEPLSSVLKGILVQVLVLEPIILGIALLGLLFFTASALYWRRRCRKLMARTEGEP